MNPFSVLFAIGAAALGALNRAAYHACDLGPTQREIERECDAHGWEYSPVHMAQARAILLQKKN